jgi:hypothetical protein
MNINEIIRERFPKERTQNLADELGLTYYQVANRAFNMGIRKSDEFKMSEHSGRHNLIEAGKKSRFTKGHTPHNKGKKMSDDVYQKVKGTMWEPGHRPHNWKPDGTVLLRSDGYLYYKISDGNWILYHQKIWMDVNGEIPKGSIVVFRDKNRMNCELNNLELITLTENIDRNTIRRYPEEVQQIIKLNSKLKKKINGKKQNQ